jgi:formylglycine-generating enzyme required for sulfatase activity
MRKEIFSAVFVVCAGLCYAQQSAVPAGFVHIEGGAFTMGSPASEAGRFYDEAQHQVTVSGFYMGMYEVTQAEWVEVMGKNPSNFKGDNLPVEQVSWYDVTDTAISRKQCARHYLPQALGTQALREPTGC